MFFHFLPWFFFSNVFVGIQRATSFPYSPDRFFRWVIQMIQCSRFHSVDVRICFSF